MGIYETIGMSWVILTSSIATVSILYLAYIGLRVTLRHGAIQVENVADPAIVRTIPVVWGRKGHEHAVDVQVR